MRKRRESDQKKPKEMKITSRKTCFIVLFLLVLCSWMIPSIAVYGFDVSGMDSFDTGGFDMNVGEGTGQLPEDWEESYAGAESDASNWNREEGNTEEYSAAWAESENDQEESAQWNLDFQTDEVRSQEESFMENGNTAAEVEIADTPAEKLTETPIGCVIVYEGKVIARGYNRRNTDKNTLSHAELNAIRKASKKLGDWRLEGCTLYVTLEPCQMCAGAIVQARVSEVVIGSMNPKAGCAGSILNMLEMHEFNHQVKVERGVLKEECSEMLSAFFRRLRVVKKKKKEERKRAEEGKE